MFKNLQQRLFSKNLEIAKDVCNKRRFYRVCNGRTRYFTFNFSRWHIPFATCQANIIRVLKISTAVLSLPNLGAVSCRFVRDEHCLRYERRSPLDANSSTNISVPEGLKTIFRYHFNYKKNQLI